MSQTPNKYQRHIGATGATVDVYDVIEAFFICCPAVQHAIKKLLAPGQRGHKSIMQDLHEAQQSISRAIQLEAQREAYENLLDDKMRAEELEMGLVRQTTETSTQDYGDEIHLNKATVTGVDPTDLPGFLTKGIATEEPVIPKDSFADTDGVTMETSTMSGVVSEKSG